jgi:aminoglycoside phosphotransferase
LVLGDNEQINSANFVLERLDFKLSRGQYNADVVSFGYDCLPRTISAKWGLKRTRALGEKSCPFDLAVTPIGCIA